jgi:hypothetical protein
MNQWPGLRPAAWLFRPPRRPAPAGAAEAGPPCRLRQPVFRGLRRQTTPATAATAHRGRWPVVRAGLAGAAGPTPGASAAAAGPGAPVALPPPGPAGESPDGPGPLHSAQARAAAAPARARRVRAGPGPSGLAAARPPLVGRAPPAHPCRRSPACPQQPGCLGLGEAEVGRISC